MYFEFDGRRSDEFPVYIIQTESGMITTEISGEKSLKYDKVPYQDKIYYYYTELDNLKFKIIICPLDNLWTNELKFELFKWLGTRKPSAFKSCDNLNKMCYCICTNAMELVTNGLDEGYMELEFEATTPYWLSVPIIIEKDLTNITVPYTFTLENKSNVRDPKTNLFIYYPKMEFELVGSTTSITLINLSNGGKVTQFTDLSTGEILYMDCSKDQILSSTGLSRVENWNKIRFGLIFGTNTIVINEKCKYKFVMQFPIYI